MGMVGSLLFTGGLSSTGGSCELGRKIQLTWTIFSIFACWYVDSEGEN